MKILIEYLVGEAVRALFRVKVKVDILKNI